MARKHRSTEELRKASSHLMYEVWMLNALARGMQSGVLGQGAVNNAVLEAFGIHVRALIWFFYAKDPRTDDIVADDFLAEPDQWSATRPHITTALELAKQRADKEIAHLTYTRLDVTPEEKLWEFMPIAMDMELVVKRFLQLMPESLLVDETREMRGGAEEEALGRKEQG